MDRFASLPRAQVLGFVVPVATTWSARLLGLARLDRERAPDGLLIPDCAAVHTIGMRFALELLFLDRGWRVIALHRAVPPRRFAMYAGAAAVLELPAAQPDARLDSER